MTSALVVLVCTGGAFLGLASPAFGYEVLTHVQITRLGLTLSQADTRLKGDLLIDTGLDLDIQGMTLADAATKGARDEDEQCCARFLNHFHNPLKTDWFAAGLRSNAPALPIRIGASSIEWGQTDDHELQGWSWNAARRYFTDALATAAASERDAALSKLFEALGHLTHLVQDAASVPHVRNDAHVSYNFETFVEAVQSREGLEPGSIRPSNAWWALPGSARAPVPVARLIDSDRYDGANPAVTVDGEFIGLAEYANVNFFSEETIFGRSGRVYESFAFPARSSVERRVFTLGADATGPNREYYWKTGDGDSGYRLATVSFLRHYDSIYNVDQTRFSEKPALDDYVYRDYMARLLPRAVGYSTALIDYFFRGRLDVGLLDELDNPRVVGTNASDEPLRDGRLFVYAEDEAGVRRAVSDSAGVALTGPVAPGAPLPDVPVSLEGEIRQLVAVYTGGLGEEPFTSAGGGAVIGKVFTPLDVEEIYRGSASWMIRTPHVVAALPLARDEYSEVRWGDDQRFVVARASDGRSVVVFEVARATASGELLTMGEPPTAVLTTRTTASLPFAEPPTVTAVIWSHAIDYRQQIGRFGVRDVIVWNPPTNTAPGYYTPGDTQHIPIQFATAQERSFAFNGRFPVVLDEAHSADFGLASGPYVWFLSDVTADRSGRALGLVVVYLTDPGVAATPTPVFTVNSSGELVPSAFETRAFGPGFAPETDALLWAVVDLQSGEVTSTTAGDSVTIAWHQSAEEPITLFRNYVLEVVGGGPQEAIDEWTTVAPIPRATQTADVQVDVRTGYDALDISGWMKGRLGATLTDAGLLDTSVTRLQRIAYFNYECVTTSCGSDDAAYASYAIVESLGTLLAPPVQFFYAARAQAPPNAERLVLLGDAPRPGDWPRGHLVVWDGQTDRASVRLDLPPAFSRDIVPATASLALVYNRPDPFHRDTATSYLVGLDDDGEVLAFPGTDLRSSFRLLPPAFLYNVGDMKFYRRATPLQPTALPAPLQAVDGNPIGSYHVVSPQ